VFLNEKKPKIDIYNLLDRFYLSNSKLRLLITGANGFVGRSLCMKLQQNEYKIRAAVRSADLCLSNFENEIVGSIEGQTNWTSSLQDIDVVVHLAARVHVMRDHAETSLAEFRRVNVEGTLNLAKQAVAVGIRRFIYISSVKVNGEGTSLGKPFTADDKPSPIDPYGISKREAEDALLKLARETNMEVVIIRPPLVYGPGVKANFLTMMHWLIRGIPLPFGAIHNKRSFVALDNLIDLIITCINHPAAAGQIFLAGDGEDLSTPELIEYLAAALGKKAWLMPVPESILIMTANLVGQHALAQRLCGSLQVDISKTRNLLGWNPPVSIDGAFNQTAQHFLHYHQ
jgi:nucleoside-diphosphate-sugar epimerase